MLHINTVAPSTLTSSSSKRQDSLRGFVFVYQFLNRPKISLTTTITPRISISASNSVYSPSTTWCTIAFTSNSTTSHSPVNSISSTTSSITISTTITILTTSRQSMAVTINYNLNQVVIKRVVRARTNSGSCGG
ncbi:unnamed protein product [Rotaria sordida]|uniref:Uncharacterized protein n=1 Tax=Rotaria sordida TaxID=392033 RepID=A0A814XWL4_9BILA|nr:unnamed protein product [Rotaria sordida]